jgi:hypothetical protein
MSMNIPYERWYGAIPRRRSRRQYLSRPVAPDLLLQLKVLCDEFRPFRSARAAFVDRPPDEVFRGIVGHYGKIKGAQAFVAFVGDMNDPCVQEQVGYTGEGIILEATSLGLGTCWVGGFFRPEVAASYVRPAERERVIAVTPIGYTGEEWSFEERAMAGFGKSHRRKDLAELTTGMNRGHQPQWVEEALNAARLAPSAVNRQPWRFRVEAGAVTVSVDNLKDSYHISKRLDCGIAMLHIEISAMKGGIRGTWEFLKAPDVARWRVAGGT